MEKAKQKRDERKEETAMWCAEVPDGTRYTSASMMGGWRLDKITSDGGFVKENTEAGIHGLFHMQNRWFDFLPTQGTLSPVGQAGGFC